MNEFYLLIKTIDKNTAQNRERERAGQPGTNVHIWLPVTKKNQNNYCNVCSKKLLKSIHFKLCLKVRTESKFTVIAGKKVQTLITR